MSHTLLLSVDPGLSSGVSLGSFRDDTGYAHHKSYQVGGGAIGLAGLLRELDEDFDLREEFVGRDVVVVCEKFTARQGLTRAMEESLRGEGWLVGEGWIGDYTPKSSVWGQPAQQYFAGGKDLADKKKRAYAWLKEHGLYVTGKDVGQKDADDARSAMLHAIAYLRRIQHAPTLKEYFS